MAPFSLPIIIAASSLMQLPVSGLLNIRLHLKLNRGWFRGENNVVSSRNEVGRLGGRAPSDDDSDDFAVPIDSNYVRGVNPSEVDNYRI